MIAKLSNLTDQIDMDEQNIKEFMFCLTCGSESSANLGDYFMIDDPNYVFKCCGQPMEIVSDKKGRKNLGGEREGELDSRR